MLLKTKKRRCKRKNGFCVFAMKRLIVIFAVFICIGVSSASFISMTPSVSSEKIIQGNNSIINLTLANFGDEAAYDVSASIVMPGGLHANDLFLGRLNPNETYSGKFEADIGENMVPGKYTILLMVDYKDANGHPFSAVSAFSLVIKTVSVSKLTPKINELDLAVTETKELKMSVRNIDNIPHQVTVSMFLPRELSSDISEKTIIVDKKSDKDIAFTVSSFGALPGSNYAIFAVVSYEESGLYYSSFSSGVIHVIEKETLPSWIPIALLLLLVFFFVIYQFRK